MKKIIDKLKKYKLIIIIALIIVIIGTTLIFILNGKNIDMYAFNNNYYDFNYDKTWQVKDKSDLSVSLNNKDKASLNIELINIDDEYKYSDLSDIIDDLLYTINSQNSDYKLISKKEDKVTKLGYSGYKLLYENDESQAMITILKSGDKVVVFNYEALNKYFDILLDSVQNIIYNFALKSEKFELTSNITVNTEKMDYASNISLANKLTDTKDYIVANQNYEVNYSIPSIFKLKGFYSNYGDFEYQDSDGKIKITTNVYRTNMYDYIDSTKTYGTIYTQYSYMKELPDTYKDLKEKISEFKIGDYSGYIYKISYTYHFVDDRQEEKYIIAVAINKNHMFEVKIEGEGIKIPQKLIEQIKINSVNNYSSYIVRNVENGYFNVELKQFKNYNYKDYYLINLKLPEKYRETASYLNVYTKRYFGLNYDYDNEVYQYDIDYDFSNYYVDAVIKSANSSMNSNSKYGTVLEMKEEEPIILNDKKFLVYSGSYYKKGALYNSNESNIVYKVNKKILVYELENSRYLMITIDANDTDINEDILRELTDFSVSEEVYNN